MSRRKQVRKAVRWARYVNHYCHIPGVQPSGSRGDVFRLWGLFRCPSYRIVRRQAKHRFGEGRPS